MIEFMAGMLSGLAVWAAVWAILWLYERMDDWKAAG